MENERSKQKIDGTRNERGFEWITKVLVSLLNEAPSIGTVHFVHCYTLSLSLSLNIYINKQREKERERLKEQRLCTTMQHANGIDRDGGIVNAFDQRK